MRRLQCLLQPVADGVGHAGTRDQEGEQAGVGDDEHDHRRRDDRLAQHRRQILQADLAVDQHADDQRVQHRHGRGLGGCEHTAVDAAQDDHRHQQRPGGLAGGRPEAQAAIAVVLAPALPLAVDPDEHHQRAGDQDAGAEAGDEQLADRHFRRHAVEDHRDRGRDDHAQLGAGGLQCGGVALGVAVLDQRRDQDGADGEGGGHRRARHRREDHAGEHAGHGQATLHAAHDALGEIHQTARDAAGFHQVAGQDEEGNGRQRKLVDRVEDLLHRDQHVGVVDLDADDGRQPDRHGHRHAERKAQHHGDEHGDGHASLQAWRCVSMPIPEQAFMPRSSSAAFIAPSPVPCGAGPGNWPRCR